MKRIIALLICFAFCFNAVAGEDEKWQDFSLDSIVSLKVPANLQEFDVDQGSMFTSAVSEDVHLLMIVSPVSGVYTVRDTADLRKSYSEFLDGLMTKVDSAKVREWEMVSFDSLWMASFSLQRTGKKILYYHGHAVFIQDKMYSFTFMGPDLKELEELGGKMLASLKFKNVSFEEDQKSYIPFVNLSPAVKGRLLGVGVILIGITIAAVVYIRSGKKQSA